MKEERVTLEEVIAAATQMSNVIYNVLQTDCLTSERKKLFGEVLDKWDTTLCAYREQQKAVPSYLPYCGGETCRDTIIYLQQRANEKSGHVYRVAEAATEPTEIRVCKRHIVSFAGDEPCGICNQKVEAMHSGDTFEKLEQAVSKHSKFTQGIDSAPDGKSEIAATENR